MMKIDYNERMYKTYHDARVILPETKMLWMDVVRRYVGDREVRTILDLGCGTGRFSTLLADAFDADVIGVEPSDKMRAEAEEKSRHDRVRYLTGAGERIPVGDGQCDLAWLSMMIHHVSDMGLTAKELGRVLKPDALVFVRNCFSGRLDEIPIYEFVPSARVADDDRLPSVEEVRAAFEAVGFSFVALDQVVQVIDRTLAEHAARLRKGGVSSFELVSKEEVEEGLARMEAAAECPDAPSPVTERIDLLVLRRGPESR